MSTLVCVTDIDPQNLPRVSCERGGRNCPVIWIRWSGDAIALDFDENRLDDMQAAINQARAQLVAQAVPA